MSAWKQILTLAETIQRALTTSWLIKEMARTSNMCAFPVQNESCAKRSFLTLGFSTVYNYKTCLEGFLKIWIFEHQPRLTESKSFDAGNLFLTWVPNESYDETRSANIAQIPNKNICVFNHSSILRDNDEDVDPYIKQVTFLMENSLNHIHFLLTTNH